MKTLVFLIPTEYFGPVVAIFDQPDGVVPEDEINAQVVRVPENGIIKIKTKAKFSATHPEYPNWQVLFFSIDGKGNRSLLPQALGVGVEGAVDKGGNRQAVFSFADTRGTLQHVRYPFPNRKLQEEVMYEHAGPGPSIFAHGSCQDRGFYRWPAEESGEAHWKRITTDPNNYGVPHCAEFIVGPPLPMMKWPGWMSIESEETAPSTGYGQPNRWFDSVDELISAANKRMVLKREYFKLEP